MAYCVCIYSTSKHVVQYLCPVRSVCNVCTVRSFWSRWGGGVTVSRLSCPHLHASTSLRWKAFVSGICKSRRELHVDKAIALMHSFAAGLEAGGKADGIFQEWGIKGDLCVWELLSRLGCKHTQQNAGSCEWVRKYCCYYYRRCCVLLYAIMCW